MRTRLKDIAKDLNISAGLVSGVLNNRENVWASEDTRKRIFEAAKRLNYAHTVLERIRPAQNTGNIELLFCRRNVYPDVDFASVVDVLSSEAEKLNQSLSVKSFSNLDRALEYLAALGPSRSNSFVLWGNHQHVLALADYLDSINVSYLIPGRQETGDPVRLQFALDLERMVMGAVDHIRVLGHRRLAFIGSSADTRESTLIRTTFVDWNKSCLRIDPDKSFLLDDGPEIDSLKVQIGALMDLPKDKRPEGFVMGAGNKAWIALELALQDRNLRIGFQQGDVTASGIFVSVHHLLFGEALGYDIGDTKAIYSGTLAPLLNDLIDGKIDEKVRLFAPRLMRIPSLHLKVTP